MSEEQKKLRKEWHEALVKLENAGGFEYAYWTHVAAKRLKKLKKAQTE